MLNQYPHIIKSPKPKQSNAWRSNSVPNVYRNLNHRVNHFKSNLSGDIKTNPGPVINSTKTNTSSLQSRQCGNVWVKYWYTVCSHVTCFPHIYRGMVLYPQCTWLIS